MNEYWILHDSHNTGFRSPFGAVSCHTEVTLRLEAAVPVQTAVLRLWQEGFGEMIINMQLAETSSAKLVYEANFKVPPVAGVLWYYFIIYQDGQTVYYGNNAAETGGVGQLANTPPPSYQISTYLPGTVTPAWFKHAVVYQIFVDRFFNGLPDGKILNPRPGSLIHACWQDTPVYTRDMDTGAILAYDFFGGNLAGVMTKLPYLADLGVTAIYFNPVFAAASNHKYDTADYRTIDPMFGDNALFSQLCAKAAEYGIAVIVDGVFSHTGSDSIYFNKENSYDSLGAFQSPASPYYSWYKFSEYPDKYESWWGVDTLPNVNEEDPSYQNFIIEEGDSVLKHWLRAGVKGWRLDVADELPESFLQKFYQTLKAAEPEAVLIGEVWEDASRKVAYGKLRQYFNGTMLDGVMNYPFRKLVLDFMLGWRPAQAVHRELYSLYENYPRENFYANLNIIGSHDVPRILTLLAEAPPEDTQSKLSAHKYKLSSSQRKLGISRLKLVVLWQMTFPGVPCVYYGDEAGVEGYRDPLNRRTYPWGREEQELLTWYKEWIKLRRQYPVLQTGEWLPLLADGDVYGYVRRTSGGLDVFGDLAADNTAIVLLNRSCRQSARVTFDWRNWFAGQDYVFDAETGEKIGLPDQAELELELPPLTGRLLLAEGEQPTGAGSRTSGVLLHPTSLPSPFGIGDFGPAAYQFVDFLAAARQRLWQFLPLNPVGFGESPYQCLSAFAGNPWLISPEKLLTAGLLTEAELSLRNMAGENSECIDFSRVMSWKEPVFRLAFARFNAKPLPAAYQTFIRAAGDWLPDYTLFAALKKQFGNLPWSEWENSAKRRDAAALDYYQEELAGEIDYQRFLQFIFWQQWQELKTYANCRGIRMFGDLPLFVAHDSADVWVHPELFSLDADGNPVQVAGVPPDYFSATGQLWGNPLYNWGEMANNDYAWWRRRLAWLLRLVDLIRIDHFRGFEAYWEIPVGEPTAVNGRWIAGPGAGFFGVLQNYLGNLPLVAEDLGVITPPVKRLKHKFGYPGMKVLQFSFGDGRTAPDFPYNTGRHTVAYTGTHDNDTLLGWIQKLPAADPYLWHLIREHLTRLNRNGDRSDAAVCEQLIRLVFQSQADTVILPMQDVLGLGTSARMNIPGTIGGNWTWRLKPGMLTAGVITRLRNWTEQSGRN